MTELPRLAQLAAALHDRQDVSGYTDEELRQVQKAATATMKRLDPSRRTAQSRIWEEASLVLCNRSGFDYDAAADRAVRP